MYERQKQAHVFQIKSKILIYIPLLLSQHFAVHIHVAYGNIF